MPIQLPHKENAIFKRILKCYEQKQYKNGLKFCKQILSNPKFSEHGETLAMKGLTLSYLGKVDEAYEYVKRGLKNDLRSHVCWHVYGLLQRADQKYDEAIKCYRNALKWDKDNLQILRDLSLLQIQMRDTEGFRDTRYQLLKIRPGQRQSWIGYSISYYLLGDYDMAFSVMEEFRKTIPQETTSKPDIEHSEMLLYQNMILSEQGKIKESIDHLNKFESFMTDKLKVKEIRASYELQMKNYREAEKIYRDLVKRNPENHMYYGAIEKCLAAQKNLTQLEENGRLGMYLNYRKHYPKCEAPKRLPLSFTTGKVFKDLLSEYLRNNLIKGVPPLFKNLQNLYQDKCKVTTIEEVVTGFINTLTNERKFVSTDSEIQDPTVLLWTQFFLAQHYDHLRNTTKALKLINDVLEHTPTLIEGYMVKAKIYKHAGAIVEAAKWMDEGRSLDTADRFVNSKCAKYMLRANQVEKAIETCGMFTKEGTTPEDDLDSMQCMWFGIECARAHQRSMKIGEALRKCHQIEASFNEIVADQFDFHTYCMRKVTLCAYIKLLKLEDIIRNHPFYFEAAQVAIQCYVSLHDKPSSATQDGTETNKGGLSDKELKKLKSKQRRAQKKQQIEDMNNEKQEPKEKETKKSAEKFDPATLVSCEKPLSEAIKFLQPLQTLASEKIETHLMAYDIYSRIGKPLLMLQSIKRAFNCNSKDPRVHLRLVKLLAKVGKEKVGYNEVVRQVLGQELSLLTKEQDATIVNNQYLVSNATSLNARIAVGKARLFLNADDKEAIKMVAELPEDSTEANLQLCMDVHDWLLSKEFTEEASQYNKLCSSRFPLADVFMEEHAYQEPPIDPPS